jgi:multidrug transporter EmrE-like cation transporter
VNALLSLPYIFWLIVSAVLFAVGEFLSKKFALSPNWSYIVILLIVDAASLLSWLPAIMQKNQLSIVGVMWSVLSLLATALIGILIFSEKLNTLSFLGIVFGLISVVLLSLA